MNNLLILIKREIKLILRKLKEFIVIFVFFFFHFSFNIRFYNWSRQRNTEKIYVPILWVGVIFSLILISESFVLEDYIDGSLSELQFLGYAEEIIFLAKCIAMFFFSCSQNIILIPITSIFFGVDLTYTLNTIFIFFSVINYINIDNDFIGFHVASNKKK